MGKGRSRKKNRFAKKYNVEIAPGALNTDENSKR
jgi:hypothetical protein